MTDQERDTLLIKLAERTAWMKGKLEEVHVQTAEIPRLGEKVQRMKAQAVLADLAILVFFLVLLSVSTNLYAAVLGILL